MKHFLIVLLILISDIAYSNFGGYIKKPSEGAGSLYCYSENTSIRLIKEQLNIDLGQRVGFSGRFYFFNESNKETEITLAFPQLSYWDAPYDAKLYQENINQPGNYYPLNAELFINSNAIKFDDTLFSKRIDTYEKVKLYSKGEFIDTMMNFRHKNYPYDMPILIWNMKTIKFKPNDTIIIDIKFMRPWFYKDGVWTDGIETDGLREFDYIFETAKTWKNNQIDEFKLIVKFPNDALAYIDFNRKDYNKVGKNQIEITKKNWKPGSDENLKITWKSNYFIDSEHFKTPYYSDYSWRFATDGSIKTAWCFKEKDINDRNFIIPVNNYAKMKIPTGENGKLLYKIYSDSKFVDTIEITDGYAKDNETFSANSRPKTIELICKNYTQMINLKDSPDMQIFKLLFKIDINKGLYFKIIDFYKGTKYDDICISEIEFK